MLEDYDPYLNSFFRDVGTGISYVFQAVELFLGIGYFLGSKVVEGTVWMADASTRGYREVSTVAAIIRDEVTEFGASFARAVLLIYFAAYKVVESFCIVAVDLKNLYFHVTESLTRTIAQTSTGVAGFVSAIFTDVPTQTVEALSMIGESFIVCCECCVAVLKDFVLQIIMSPINVVLLMAKTLVKLVLVPVNFFSRMPTSSFIGLVVLVMLLFISRRLLRYFVVRNIRLFFNSILSIVSRAVSFIPLPQIKKLIKSSVSTLASANEQRSYIADHSKPTCVICQENPVTFMSNPCKHVCLCDVCVHGLIEHDNRCPMCRSRVTKYDRVFIP